MSGILDSKTRMLDTLVTLEGRKQIAAGKLEPAWVSFSDAGAFYEADVASGSSDASVRLHFEACSLPQDQITFKATDAGNILPFPNSQTTVALGGKIFSGTNLNSLGQVSDEQFAGKARNLLSSSLENFKRLYCVGTFDDIFDENVFGAGPTNITFTVTDDVPFDNTRAQSANVTQLEGLFQDRKLSHLRNFQYLPPLMKVSDPSIDVTDAQASKAYRLGQYPPLGPVDELTYDQLLQTLLAYEKVGNYKVIKFDPTSHKNRLAAQFFELQRNTLSKLSVIDFGKHYTKETQHGHKRVYFIGKMLSDDNDVHTFIHLFTLVFE